MIPNKINSIKLSLGSSLSLPANGLGGLRATSFNLAECKTWRIFTKPLEPILAHIFSCGILQGRGQRGRNWRMLVSSAQLRYAEPRELCMVGLLAHPTAVGFANPIDEDKRGIMPVACERLTKSLRVTAGTFTKSAN